MTKQILDTLSLFILLSNIFLVALFIFFVLSRFVGGVKKYWVVFSRFVSKNGLILAFLVSLAGTSGSLFSSEIANLSPCVLCWYQRIFMYPLVVILGVALLKKTRDVVHYALPLSIIGGLIAAYHYYLQMSADALAPCSSIGFSISCSDRFITNYGFITIPWMSLTGFVLIIVFLYFYWVGKTKK